MRIFLLDLVWHVTPLWVGEVVEHFTGKVWQRWYEPKTGKTVRYCITTKAELERL